MQQQDTSSDTLRREIREQSEAEAKGILEQADKEAKLVFSNSRKEAEKIRREILKDAETRAENVRRRVLSSLHLEEKRHSLRAREKLIQGIIQALEERLALYRRDKTYLTFLEKVIVEGVLALEGNAFSVQVGKDETHLLNRKTLDGIEKEINRQAKRKVSLSLSPDTLSEGGAVIVSSDGRMLFDNRFSARMERVEHEMRQEMVKRIGD